MLGLNSQQYYDGMDPNPLPLDHKSKTLSIGVSSLHIGAYSLQTSGQLRELLDTALSWDFEIFRLEDLTRGRPLAHLGLALMGGRFDVCAALECDERTLLHWLTIIETNYHAVNTYHNSTHAADVLQVINNYVCIAK